jgi:hypothetical protein
MPQTTEVERALLDGARRSMVACSVPANDPVIVRFWRRHRWKIIGIGLFILMDLIGLGSLAGGHRGPS